MANFDRFDLDALSFEERCEALSGLMALFQADELDEDSEAILFETLAVYPEVAAYFERLPAHHIQSEPAGSALGAESWNQELDEALFSYTEDEAAIWSYLDFEDTSQNAAQLLESLKETSGDQQDGYARAVLQLRSIREGIRFLDGHSSHKPWDETATMRRVMNEISALKREADKAIDFSAGHSDSEHQSVIPAVRSGHSWLDWLAPLGLSFATAAVVAIAVFKVQSTTSTIDEHFIAESAHHTMSAQIEADRKADGLATEDDSEDATQVVAIQEINDVDVEEIDSEGSMTSIFETDAHHVKIIWIAGSNEVNS